MKIKLKWGEKTSHVLSMSETSEKILTKSTIKIYTNHPLNWSGTCLYNESRLHFSWDKVKHYESRLTNSSKKKNDKGQKEAHSRYLW